MRRRPATLRAKILAIMAIPFVVLAASTAVLVLSRVRTSQSLAAERYTASVLEQVHTVERDLVEREDSMRGYDLTARLAFLVLYDDAVARLPADLDRLHSLVADDPSQAGRIDRLERVANVSVALLQEIRSFAPVTSVTNRDQLTAELLRGKSAMDQVQGIIGQIEASQERLLAERRRALDLSREVSFAIGVVGTPIGLLAALVVVWLFTQRLIGRIRGAEENARRMEEGILPEAPSDADDEMGRLERALARSGTKVLELQHELRRMGTIDPLTRLTNRRGFIPSAEHELQRCRRANEPIALMFADVDGLKTVNDTLGHATGDAMIAEAAYALRSTFRASDLVARVGGDEFCVLFAVGSAFDADAADARLDRALCETNAQEGRPFTLALSTGTALFDPERPAPLDELLAEADRRMYACKSERAGAGPGPIPIV